MKVGDIKVWKTYNSISIKYVHVQYETSTTQQFSDPFYGATRVRWKQKKYSPTHIYLDHQPTFVCFFHLLRPIASSLFNLHDWQSFCTTTLQVLFCLPFGLEPSTSYSIHFFTQSLSSVCNTCPYHRILFCCSTKIMHLFLRWHFSRQRWVWSDGCVTLR